MNNKRNIFFILILGACVYTNTLFHNFVGDSRALFVDNSFYKSLSNVTKVFSKELLVASSDFEPIFLGKEASFSGFISYRPIIALSFFLDYFLWKDNPFGHHLTNVLMHILASILVYFLAKVFVRNEKVALSAALLFCAHPINGEVVNHIGYRSDLLAAIFGLFSCFSFIKFRQEQEDKQKTLKWLWYCAGALLLALFSKESALCWIVLFGLHDLFYYRREVKGNSIKIGWTYFILGAVLAVYWQVYFKVFPSAHYAIDAGFLSHFGVRGLLAFESSYLYLKTFFLPFKVVVLPPVYLPVVEMSLEKMTVLIIFFSGALIAFVRSFKRERRVAFLLALSILSFLPASNIVPLPNPIAFRFFYLPSVGLCILVILAFWAGVKKIKREDVCRRMFLGVTTFVIGVCAFTSIGHNFYFRNTVINCKQMIKHYSDAPRPYWILGLTFFDAGDYVKSINYFQKYLQTPSRNPFDQNRREDFVHYRMGVSFLHLNQLDHAVVEFQKAIMLNDKMVFAYADLARTYLIQSKFNEALNNALMTIKLDPQFAPGYVYSIHAYIELDQAQSARSLLEKAFVLFPEDVNLNNFKNKLSSKEQTME